LTNLAPKRANKKKEKRMKIGIVLVVVAVFVIGCDFFEEKLPDSWNEIIEIVSIRSETTTEGHFSIGTGTIEGVVYYFAYAKGNGPGLKLIKIPSKDTQIVETDRVSPRFCYFTSFDNMDNYNSCFITLRRLYVPKGTVIREFKLQ